MGGIQKDKVSNRYSPKCQRVFSQNVALLLAVCYCIFVFSGNHFLYYSDGERGFAATSGN